MRVTVHGEDYDLRAVPFPALSAPSLLLHGAGFVVAVVMLNTSGAATAAVDLLDGQDANGALVLPYFLAANGRQADYFGLPGMPFTGGLYANVGAGAVKGSVTVAFDLLGAGTAARKV